MTTSRRPPRDRVLVPFLVVALFAVLLASCAKQTKSEPSQAGPESVDLLVFGSPEEIKGYRALIDQFHANRPGIEVRLIEAADRSDLLTRLSTSFSGGKPPDLFLINYRFFGQFASKGVLEPLGPRLAESETLRQDDFYAPALDAFRYEGELVCLPQNISSLVVYYNKDLFEARGVAAPERGWTWDEMVTKAKALTVDIDGDGNPDQYGLGVEPSLIRIAPFVWSNGGELVDDDEHPTRLALDTPEAQEALQEFIELRFVEGVIPSEAEFEAEDNEARFANGKLAMVLQSRRSTPYFRTITDFEWDVAPLPVFRQPAGILHSDAYCMTKQSDHKDAAWQFVEFALGPQGAPILARSGRTVPSLESVATSPAFLDPGEPPASSQVFLDVIPSIRALPRVSTWPEIEDAADLIIEIALWRRPTTGAALAAELDRATRPLFARAN